MFGRSRRALYVFDALVREARDKVTISYLSAPRIPPTIHGFSETQRLLGSGGLKGLRGLRGLKGLKGLKGL